MKLQQLFSFFDWPPQKSEFRGRAQADLESTEISGIYFDARQTQPNSVFVAIKGTKNDGHAYIPQAIENGALALVVEDPQKVPATYEGFILVAPDSRKMLDVLAARFYDYPSQKLFCFGVTGTNGKTSITYLLEHILNENQKLTGVIGTVNHRVGEKVWDSQMTTPDPVTVQKRLGDFVQEHALAAALEVTSHALDQKRTDSVHFNTVIFTNLTHDHLDYHQNMKHYFESKQKLFTDLMWISLKKPLFAIINTDDDYGRKLKLADPVIGWTYGQKESDFQFKIIKMNFTQTTFELQTPLEKFTISIPLSGIYMIYNVVACLAAALTFGVSIESSVKSLQKFAGVPGRLQRVPSSSGKIVFVDYAHTPDALESTLRSLKKINEQMKSASQIITVFGCGGDRDKTKRPMMAKIGAEQSDFVFVTSDNPRTENPDQIILDIQAGIPEGYKNYQIEPDREKAIAAAIRHARNDDVVLIAGKGHEDYQIIGTTRNHFSDIEVAQKYLG